MIRSTDQTYFDRSQKILRPDCLIKPAEMFAVGPERNYREQALMILGQEHHLKDIYELAANFNQNDLFWRILPKIAPGW